MILVVALLFVLPAVLFAAGAGWSALLGNALATDRPPASPDRPADG